MIRRHYRRNADERLRELERLAALGDRQAAEAVVRHRLRTGQATIQWLIEAGPEAVRAMPEDLRLDLAATVLAGLDSDPARPLPPDYDETLMRAVVDRLENVGVLGWIPFHLYPSFLALNRPGIEDVTLHATPLWEGAQLPISVSFEVPHPRSGDYVSLDDANLSWTGRIAVDVALWRRAVERALLEVVEMGLISPELVRVPG